MAPRERFHSKALPDLTAEIVHHGLEWSVSGFKDMVPGRRWENTAPMRH